MLVFACMRRSLLMTKIWGHILLHDCQRSLVNQVILPLVTQISGGPPIL